MPVEYTYGFVGAWLAIWIARALVNAGRDAAHRTPSDMKSARTDARPKPHICGPQLSSAEIPLPGLVAAPRLPVCLCGIRTSPAGIVAILLRGRFHLWQRVSTIKRERRGSAPHPPPTIPALAAPAGLFQGREAKDKFFELSPTSGRDSAGTQNSKICRACLIAGRVASSVPRPYEGRPASMFLLRRRVASGEAL